MRKVAKGKLQRCERLVILLITIVIMLSNTPCKSRRKTFWFMRNAQSMTSSLTYNNVVCYSHSPSHTPAPTMLLCVLLCTHDVAYLPTYPEVGRIYFLRRIDYWATHHVIVLVPFFFLCFCSFPTWASNDVAETNLIFALTHLPTYWNRPS